MKKILNYIITYMQEDENKLLIQKEELYFSKKYMLTRYLNILDSNNEKSFPFSGVGSISSLKILVAYVNYDDIEDITGKINKFIYK